jgi:hypothetical protein
VQHGATVLYIKYQVLLREGLLREERVYAQSCIFYLDNRGGLGGNSTLACGHFAQFAKAVIHGIKAVFPNISDRFGRLNKAHLSSVDAELKDIIEKGWMQKKIKFGVRAACPWIPALAQRACNASNLVVSHGNEVETIVSILGLSKVISMRYRA